MVLSTEKLYCCGKQRHSGLKFCNQPIIFIERKLFQEEFFQTSAMVRKIWQGVAVWNIYKLLTDLFPYTACSVWPWKVEHRCPATAPLTRSHVAASQQYIDYSNQPTQINLKIPRPAGYYLRTMESRCSAWLCKKRSLRREHGQVDALTKVDQFQERRWTANQMDRRFTASQTSRVADENVVWFQVAMYDVTQVHLLDNVKQLDAKEQDQPLGKEWLPQSVRIYKVLQKSTTKEILNSKVQV